MKHDKFHLQAMQRTGKVPSAGIREPAENLSLGLECQSSQTPEMGKRTDL